MQINLPCVVSFGRRSEPNGSQSAQIQDEGHPDEFSDWKFSPAGFSSQSSMLMGGSMRLARGGEYVLFLYPDMWLDGPKGSRAWAGLVESETPIIAVAAQCPMTPVSPEAQEHTQDRQHQALDQEESTLH